MNFLIIFLFYQYTAVSSCGKTIESGRHPNPITDPNPNPYLVAVRYGGLVSSCTEDGDQMYSEF